MMIQIARAFKALKVALDALQSFYDDLSLHPPAVPQQLTFPYVNSVTINNEIVPFTYVEELASGRFVFRAQLRGGREIVKFAETYSSECHVACYELGIAPEFLACEQVVGGWRMVVMEWLGDNESWAPLKEKGADTSSVAAAVRKVDAREGFRSR